MFNILTVNTDEVKTLTCQLLQQIRHA